ncbi:hypothetical protein SteCoe_36226 [Stentor coeruleus]|uniref:Uncharacterized protein n=1 Tax=Stentor coeruleus TaxID=5963 RepID=A0A1R2AQT3_9CILI|nr:hypothetical protein SteCoe_36226 [Stentor coeruleus]
MGSALSNASSELTHDSCTSSKHHFLAIICGIEINSALNELGKYVLIKFINQNQFNNREQNHLESKINPEPINFLEMEYTLNLVLVNRDEIYSLANIINSNESRNKEKYYIITLIKEHQSNEPNIKYYAVSKEEYNRSLKKYKNKSHSPDDQSRMQLDNVEVHESDHFDTSLEKRKKKEDDEEKKKINEAHNSINEVRSSETNPQINNKKASKDMKKHLKNLNKSSLIKLENENRLKKKANELSCNKFENSYISFDNLDQIAANANNIFIIIGHESSGRTAFIQTMLNCLENKNENTIVTERFIKACYNNMELKDYYNFGIDSQMDNEYFIVKKNNNRYTLLVETPHFSEMINPTFCEAHVSDEISKLIRLKKPMYFFIVKKSMDIEMNINMKNLLIQIDNHQAYNNPNIRFIYVFTFYASSIEYTPSIHRNPKNIKIMEISNHIYRNNSNTNININKNWRKIKKNMDKLLSEIDRDSNRNPINY